MARGWWGEDDLLIINLESAAAPMMTLVLDVVSGSVLVSFILYNTLVTIGLQQGVHSLGVVTVSRLPLALDIVVFQVMDSIVVVVVGRCLSKNTKQHYTMMIMITVNI